MTETSVILERAKTASFEAPLSSEKKNAVLLNMADALIAHTKDILNANNTDLNNAKGKISEVMLDRLRLVEKRIESMAEGIREVVKLPDPVGRMLAEPTRENGLIIQKVSVPLGVVAIIYESRPNVTSDAAALCFKS